MMRTRRPITVGARGWIGVDLDGTLAMHRAYCDAEPIGPPVPAMLDRVIAWLEQGIEVRILTARVGESGKMLSNGRRDDATVADEQRALIGAWCLQHLGRVIPITATKDAFMRSLWDDRAVRVERNTGRIVGDAD